MKNYESSALRNVAVVGHGDVGKTSLVAAFLYNTGMINRLGRVDDGTAATDFNEDEVERQISINAAAAYCCLLYTSPSPRDRTRSRMPSSA